MVILNILFVYLLSVLLLKRKIFIKFRIFKEDNNMPALPQAAFAACKMRSHIERQNSSSSKNIAKIQKVDEDNKSKQETPKNFSDKKLMEYTIVKYNGKLMNSIWGFYNRYSPHNIKGNDDEIQSYESNLQQPLAVVSNVIAKNIAITFQSSVNEWKYYNFYKH